MPTERPGTGLEFQRRDLIAHWPADSGQPGPGSKDRHAAPQRAIGRRLDIVCPARELPEPENLAGMEKAETSLSLRTHGTARQ